MVLPHPLNIGKWHYAEYMAVRDDGFDVVVTTRLGIETLVSMKFIMPAPKV